MKHFLRKYHPVPSIVSGLFIFLVCLLPGSALPDPGWAAILQPDKWVHGFLYAGWILVYHVSGGRQPLVAAMAMLLFGGGIELFQEYVLTYRSAEWLDWLADGVGLLIGVLIGKKAISR